MGIVIGAVVAIVLVGGAVVAFTRRGPDVATQWETAATSAGLTHRAVAPDVLGRVRADVRGHSVRELAHAVTGQWKGHAVTAFEGTCGVEPDRTTWWVVLVDVTPEPRALTITRNDQLITFVLREDVLAPFTTPAQASESDELRRMTARLNFPLRIACDDDVAGRDRLAPHFDFLVTTPPRWVMQSAAGQSWYTTPVITPAGLTESLDRAVATVEALDILRRPWQS